MKSARVGKFPTKMKTWQMAGYQLTFGWLLIGVVVPFSLYAEEGDGAPPKGTTMAGATISKASPELPRLEEIDQDSDGRVSEEEFLAYQEERSKARFLAGDHNGDGAIDAEELDLMRQTSLTGTPGTPPSRMRSRLEGPASLQAQSAVAGGLRFASLRTEAKATAGEESVRVTFAFSNPQTQPIRIEDIKTSCGCLSAKADREIYAPGQAGRIEAELSTKNLQGNQLKTITVITDWKGDGDGDSSSKDSSKAVLTASVEVPRVSTIEPKMTHWKPSETQTPRLVDYLVQGDTPIEITEISSSRPNVKVNLKTIDPGRHYQIEIAPQAWDQTQVGVVRIRTDKAGTDAAFFRIEADE